MKNKALLYCLAIIGGSLAFFVAFTGTNTLQIAAALLVWILIFFLLHQRAEGGFKRKLHIIGGLEIAVYCLALAFRNTDLEGIIKSLVGINYFWLAIALISVFLSMFFRATRWYYILLPTKKIRIHNLFASIMIGFMGNCVLPMRIGEFMRAYSISRKEDLKFITSFTTIVLERIIDGLAVITIFILLLFFPIEAVEERMGDISLKHVGFIVCIIYVAAIAFLFLLRLKSATFIRLTRKLVSRISARLADKVAHVLDSFLIGLSSLKSPAQLLQIGFHSILVWVSIIGVYVGVIKAFGIEIPFYGYLLLQVFVVVGVMIPTPGFVGPFHYFFTLALTKGFDIDPSQAGACAIIAHALGFVPIVIVGMIYFLHENLSLKEVEEASEESEKLD